MPESARETDTTRQSATPPAERTLVLDGQSWIVTETRVPGPGRETVYLIRFTAGATRELNVTLPLSSAKLSDAELADVWLRCLLWEQDA